MISFISSLSLSGLFRQERRGSPGGYGVAREHDRGRQGTVSPLELGSIRAERPRVTSIHAADLRVSSHTFGISLIISEHLRNGVKSEIRRKKTTKCVHDPSSREFEVEKQPDPFAVMIRDG